jgi:hypothetical protein
MVDVKTSKDHPSSMAERINKRLRNSGETGEADTVTKTGEGPQRVFHNLHNPGSARQHGPARDSGS